MIGRWTFNNEYEEDATLTLLEDGSANIAIGSGKSTTIPAAVIDALSRRALQRDDFSMPETLLDAVRAVYRERTADAILRLREVAMSVGAEQYPDAEAQDGVDGRKHAAFAVLCRAIDIVGQEVQPMVLNLYSGLIEGR